MDKHRTDSCGGSKVASNKHRPAVGSKAWGKERLNAPSRQNEDDDIIVISSDEETIEPSRLSPLPKSSKQLLTTTKPKTPRRVRRIVQSSEESADSGSVIDISDSSADEAPTQLKPAVKPKAKFQSRPDKDIPATINFASTVDGGEILIWNAPRSPKKPIRALSDVNIDPPPSTPRRGKGSSTPFKEPASSTASKKSGPSTPSTKTDASTPSKEVASRSGASSPLKKARLTQKARAEAQQQQLAEFARNLFVDLNRTVFDDGLPTDVELLWSKTLRVTAGRASYSRNRMGEVTSKIELAVKVLDSEDRVKMTLSHEMCHLACWIINKKVDENHGALFESWAKRVQSRHPDIHVSTTHDYEIKFKYSWKCQGCEFIYGRHSKSIKPAIHRCGRCKTGTLEPQFVQRTRKAPQTPKISRLAPSKSQDSPLRHSPQKDNAKEPDGLEISVCSVEISDDEEEASDGVQSDDEVEVLAMVLAGTAL